MISVALGKEYWCFPRKISRLGLIGQEWPIRRRSKPLRRTSYNPTSLCCGMNRLQGLSRSHYGCRPQLLTTSVATWGLLLCARILFFGTRDSACDIKCPARAFHVAFTFPSSSQRLSAKMESTDFEEFKDTPREHDAPADLVSKPEAAPGLPQPGDFPEGGTRAWLTVAGGWATLFVSFGWVNCVGIFQNYYQTHQLSEYSSSEIAWIPALQGTLRCESPSTRQCTDTAKFDTVFFMLFSGIITGKLFDEYGPAVPLAVGTFLHVFGIMMISLSTEFYQLLLSQSVCSGIGASLIFFPSSTCVSRLSWSAPFPCRFGR